MIVFQDQVYNKRAFSDWSLVHEYIAWHSQGFHAELQKHLEEHRGGICGL